MSANSFFEKYEQHVHRTFREAAARYVEELQLRGRDQSRPKQSIDALMPYIGDKRLIEIDDEALKPFKHDRTHGAGHFKKKAMAGTTNKDLVQVSTILHAACRVWGWIPSTPKFILVSGDERSGYAMSWDEQDRVFRHLPNGWDVGVGLFAINTGCRKEEIFGLRWDDLVMVPEIGPEMFVLVLNRTKNGKKRPVIPNSIARRVVGHFKERAADPEFIFTKALTRCQYQKSWQVAWRLAGLPNDPLYKRGIHNCRHSFAHRLRAAGVGEEDRNFLLGHNNKSLAQHYAMPDIRRLFDAAELITVRRETTIIRSSVRSDRDRFLDTKSIGTATV